MKKLLLLAIIAFNTIIVNAQWERTSLDSTYVLTLAISGNNIFAGTWCKGVYMSSNNGNSWSAVNTGLTYTQVEALAISGNNIFAGTDVGGVYLSSNNGGLWTQVNTGLTNKIVKTLAIDSNNIFAGTQGSGVYMSSNNGNSWTSKGINDSVLAIAVRGNYIFAGSRNGLYLSSNYGNSWTHENNGLPFDTWIRAFAFKGNNIFAADWSCNGIYISSNNGLSWSLVNTGLTVYSKYVVALAVSGNYVFAGTWGGVYVTNNDGASWTEINTGLIDTNVWALAVNEDYLFAGTYTKGVWRLPLSELGINEINKNNTFSVYPNPATTNLTIQTTQKATSDSYRIEITNIEGYIIKTFNITNPETTIDVSSLSGGVYIIKMQSDKGVVVRKFIKE